jgi:hypothetical protein
LVPGNERTQRKEIKGEGRWEETGETREREKGEERK